ncbi:MAG: hypothetical protein IMZ47_04310, partial [Firmicutes bacterium]|nr:hypothetical protein [Bacillota bacterium]
MSVGMHGWGSALAIGGTDIGNITSISKDGPKRASLDVSTMDSSNTWSEFIPGMKDAGQLTIGLMYDGTTVSQILHAQMTATASTMLITFSDASTYQCSGILTDLGEEVPYEDK